VTAASPGSEPAPLVVEDLLLLLFDPRNGTIAGEGTLFYTLAGALLADLALAGQVEADDAPTLTGRRVRATGAPPSDPLLRDVWDRLATKPRGVQTVLAEVGPHLRGPVLDRLVDAGHVRREERRILGVLPSTRLSDGGTPRRDDLLAAVRPVLVDDAEPDERTAVLVALLSGSGCLPLLHRDVPWSGRVYQRGKEMEHGDWGASAVGQAVTRTVVATAASTLAVVTASTAGGQG
jgi:hypothetical protein